MCQFTCAELRKEDRMRAPCIRIKIKCCFKSAVSVSYVTMLAQLLCLLVFFIDWPFKQYKPTPEMITLPVPLLPLKVPEPQDAAFHFCLLVEFFVLIG